MGDYLNDWNVDDEIENDAIDALAEFIGKHGDTVTMLLGNHDLPYLMEQSDSLYEKVLRQSPGFRQGCHDHVHGVLSKLPVSAAFGFQDGHGGQWLCTHAGLTAGWLHDHKRELKVNEYDEVPSASAFAQALNRLLDHGAYRSFNECGVMRGGYSRHPSPIWADRKELRGDPIHNLNQVVGHTPLSTATQERSMFHEHVFTDTFSTWSDDSPIGDYTVAIMDVDTASIRFVRLKDYHNRHKK